MEINASSASQQQQALILYRRFLDQSCNLQRLSQGFHHETQAGGQQTLSPPGTQVPNNQLLFNNNSLSTNGVIAAHRPLFGLPQNNPNSGGTLTSGVINSLSGQGITPNDMTQQGQKIGAEIFPSLTGNMQMHLSANNSSALAAAGMNFNSNMAAASLLFSNGLPGQPRTDPSSVGGPPNGANQSEEASKLAAIQQNHWMFIQNCLLQQHQHRERQLAYLAAGALASTNQVKTPPAGQDPSQISKLQNGFSSIGNKGQPMSNGKQSPGKDGNTTEKNNLKRNALNSCENLDDKNDVITRGDATDNCISGASGSTPSASKVARTEIRLEVQSQGKTCPVCREFVAFQDLKSHLMTEMQKFNENLKNRKSVANSRQCGASSARSQSNERIEIFTRIRSGRQDRITSLSNRLRHLNRSCYNLSTTSNNSQHESHTRMQTSPSISINADDVITTSNLIGRTNDPMASPSSPTSVITRSLNHFDVEFSEPRTTQMGKNSPEGISPNGKKLMLIETILNDQKCTSPKNSITQSRTDSQHETRSHSMPMTKSMTPLVRMTSPGIEPSVSEVTKVAEDDFQRLTSSAGLIEVR